MTSFPSATAAPARLTLAGAADAVTAAQLRRTLQQWLQHVAEPSSGVHDDVVLAVNEALANCVDHAYRAQHTVGTMRLRADYDRVAQSIRVCVSDCGTWYRRPATKSNDPYASRGIRLMHALSDHCTIDTRPDGTTVCLDYTADSKAVKNP